MKLQVNEGPLDRIARLVAGVIVVAIAVLGVGASPLAWIVGAVGGIHLDGELDSATASAVEGHLAGCPTCPPLYATLVGVRVRLEGLRDPDTVVEDRVAARVRTHVAMHLHGGPGVPADHAHAVG